MPWFRVDDGFWSHPKTLQLSDGAQALWMRAGSWSMHHLTDGLIPAFALQLLGAKPRFVAELVAVSLWIPDEGAYRFHDWSRYQPTRTQVEADRDAAAERKRRSREKSRRDTTVTDGVGSGDAAPSPSQPTPTHPTPPNGGEDIADRADVDELCDLLADLVEENGSKRPAVTKAWRESARLLIDRDGRELEAAKRLVRWAQGDSFWQGNVLSMPTFRKQYDRLRLAANRQLEERRQTSPRTNTRDAELFAFATAADTSTPSRQEITR